MTGKSSRVNPRMLSHVLQAVADLKDVYGSTAKKILDQVQTAINISNVKPKPRNIVIQVRKALKHAVDTRILKFRSGKYKLVLGQEEIPVKKLAKTCKKRTHRKRKDEPPGTLKSRGKCKKPDRRKNQRLRRKRKPCKNRSPPPNNDDSMSTTTYHTDYYDDASSMYSNYRPHSRGKHGSYTRKRYSGKKHVTVKQPQKARGRKRKRNPKKRVRKGTPIPVLSKKSIGRLDDNTFGTERYQEDLQPQDCPPEIYRDPNDVHCDNPDCLCNFKQEPDDDVNGSEYMT